LFCFVFFKENSVVCHKRASPLVVNSAHETTETSVTFAYVIGRLVAESMFKVMDWKCYVGGGVGGGLTRGSQECIYDSHSTENRTHADRNFLSDKDVRNHQVQ
jgi:hypothetical protein